MKVLFATYDSVSIDHGGPRVQILETRKALERLGVAVDLFERWEPWDAARYDLVHLFGARLATFQLARTLSNHGIPFVVSPIFYSQHSPFLLRMTLAGETLLRKVHRGIWSDYGYTRRVCEWSRGVLPNTAAEGALIVKGLGIEPGKVRVVPNGVDLSFRRGDPEIFFREYGIRDFILSVGHIGPARKNVHRLIRALETIDRNAVIIGRVSGNDESEMCLSEAKRNPRLLLIPGLDHASPLLSSAYAACDTFVLPSLFETPGIAALEAGLAGAKIVITAAGGTKEYFGENAVYVDPYSVRSIRDGILTALSKNRNETLLHHIEREFSWEAVGMKTLAAYEAFLSRA